MQLRLSSLMVLRLWAALLLAVVGLQATAPAAPTVDKTHGSAFAATTYEVALHVRRSEHAARPVVAPQPPLARAAVERPLAASASALPAAWPVRPASTGPPPRDLLAWQPAPRAPPYA